MSLNISLYTVSAVLILDNEGRRLYAKYYQPSLTDAGTSSTPAEFENQSQQHKFETNLFSKINKVHQDIILYDNHLITYKQTNDIILIFETIPNSD